MPITWLASYPRSGNTWMRFLLYTYLFGEINDSWSVNERIPPIHRPQMVNPDFPGRLLVKTHFRYSPMHPHLGRTAGFVYIYRHPRDVLLSGLNYRQLGGAVLQPVQYARQFIELGGDPAWAQMGFGRSYLDHLDSWIGDGPDAAKARFPHVALRYEDLKADPAGQFRRVLEFIGESVDESRLAFAVEACAFEKLQELEKREKESGSARQLFPGNKAIMEQGRLFMHKGQSGRTLDEVDPALEPLFAERFAPVLRRLGYDA